jgi:hypothetical protein
LEHENIRGKSFTWNQAGGMFMLSGHHFGCIYDLVSYQMVWFDKGSNRGVPGQAGTQKCEKNQFWPKRGVQGGVRQKHQISTGVQYVPGGVLYAPPLLCVSLLFVDALFLYTHMFMYCVIYLRFNTIHYTWLVIGNTWRCMTGRLVEPSTEPNTN